MKTRGSLPSSLFQPRVTSDNNYFWHICNWLVEGHCGGSDDPRGGWAGLNNCSRRVPPATSGPRWIWWRWTATIQHTQCRGRALRSNSLGDHLQRVVGLCLRTPWRDMYGRRGQWWLWRTQALPSCPSTDATKACDDHYVAKGQWTLCLPTVDPTSDV